LVATYYPIFGFSATNNSDVIEDRTEIRNNNSNAVIKEAYTWLGVVELTGNNDHPRIAESMNFCGLSGKLGYPWCTSSMAKIHYDAGVQAPHSARVVDWFTQNLIWKREWGEKMIQIKPGMVGALYYKNLGRYGHIVLIVAEDKNNYYTLEGNTNAIGSREGEGFYKKMRSKESIAVIADYCLNGKLFEDEYNILLAKMMN